MNLPVTLLFFWTLATLATSSPAAGPSATMLNSTFEEKHGCPTQGCPHNSARSQAGFGGLEAAYGVIVISVAALL
ncbi:hypothetical protein V8E51_009036 [Hyaloscypha variabilis]